MAFHFLPSRLGTAKTFYFPFNYFIDNERFKK